MSAQNQAILETVSRRNILQQQDDDDQVLVRDVVIVNQDGSGNFSTITDVVVAAPNNSMSTSGYFLIYITAGIYEEYVSIAKNKKYLMMIGDDINQTIITGNHSTKRLQFGMEQIYPPSIAASSRVTKIHYTR